jgi:tRNA pseudouridine55 synthase
MDGILNILKPPGMTSHDIVSRMRRLTRERKIGHGGTLDPGAAGVLPVFLGKATRLIEYGIEWDKAYRVELTLGGRSETGDDASEIFWDSVEKYPSLEEVKSILASFVGDQEQIPPMYSALKVNGKKLYELAREGIVIERQARPITIHKIQLLSYEAPILRFDVDCSKGTYIRTLCEDMAAQFGLNGVMTFLLRTRAGAFSIQDAILPKEDIMDWESLMIDGVFAVENFPELVLNYEDGVRFCSGQRLALAEESFEGKVRVTANQIFLGIGEVNSRVLSAKKVFVDLRKEKDIL